MKIGFQRLTVLPIALSLLGEPLRAGPALPKAENVSSPFLETALISAGLLPYAKSFSISERIRWIQSLLRQWHQIPQLLVMPDGTLAWQPGNHYRIGEDPQGTPSPEHKLTWEPGVKASQLDADELHQWLDEHLEKAYTSGIRKFNLNGIVTTATMSGMGWGEFLFIIQKIVDMTPDAHSWKVDVVEVSGERMLRFYAIPLATPDLSDSDANNLLVEFLRTPAFIPTRFWSDYLMHMRKFTFSPHWTPAIRNRHDFRMATREFYQEFDKLRKASGDRSLDFQDLYFLGFYFNRWMETLIPLAETLPPENIEALVPLVEKFHALSQMPVTFPGLLRVPTPLGMFVLLGVVGLDGDIYHPLGAGRMYRNMRGALVHAENLEEMKDKYWVIYPQSRLTQLNFTPDAVIVVTPKELSPFGLALTEREVRAVDKKVVKTIVRKGTAGYLPRKREVEKRILRAAFGEGASDRAAELLPLLPIGRAEKVLCSDFLLGSLLALRGAILTTVTEETVSTDRSRLSRFIDAFIYLEGVNDKFIPEAITDPRVRKYLHALGLFNHWVAVGLPLRIALEGLDFINPEEGSFYGGPLDDQEWDIFEAEAARKGFHFQPNPVSVITPSQPGVASGRIYRTAA